MSMRLPKSAEAFAADSTLNTLVSGAIFSAND
jgi:hypothetical protein